MYMIYVCINVMAKKIWENYLQNNARWRRRACSPCQRQRRGKPCTGSRTGRSWHCLRSSATLLHCCGVCPLSTGLHTAALIFNTFIKLTALHTPTQFFLLLLGSSSQNRFTWFGCGIHFNWGERGNVVVRGWGRQS